MSLQEHHIDALTEIINIGVGRAASVLNEMVGCHVQLKVPSIMVRRNLADGDDLDWAGSDRLACVKISFSGALRGAASLVFPPDSATKLVALLTDEPIDSPDLESFRVETLNEVGNIVINAVMGSIGNILEEHIHYRFPSFSEISLRDIIAPYLDGGGAIIIARTDFNVEEHGIKGDVILIFEVESFEHIITVLDAS